MQRRKYGNVILQKNIIMESSWTHIIANYLDRKKNRNENKKTHTHTHTYTQTDRQYILNACHTLPNKYDVKWKIQFNKILLPMIKTHTTLIHTTYIIEQMFEMPFE